MEDGRNEPKPEVPAPPSTLSRVHKAFSRESAVLNPKTGTSAPYQNRGWMEPHVKKDPSQFNELKKIFDETRDASGKTMTEVCEEYWRKKRGNS